MDNNEQFNEEIEFEYIDEEFFDMDIDEKIKYLKLNPDKKINPENVEDSYFFDLGQDVLAKGEKELYITILKKYFEAAVELQHELYYRRARPDFDAIYQYGVYLLNNIITPFEDIDSEVKKMLISFCIMNEYIELDDDEFLDQYPQLTTFYQNLDKFAYADDDAICPMMLRSVGKAYQIGTKHFEQDLEKAFHYFEIGSGFDYDGRQVEWPFQKVADCLYELGACYMKGLGVERDLDEAIRCFASAAKEYGLNSVPAMAEIYLDEDFAWEDYFDKKSDLIIAAYDAYKENGGDLIYFQHDWDRSYDDYDEGKIENIQKCIIAGIKELADNGNVDAKYRLADAYEYGIFVEKNPELAFKYHSGLMNEGSYPHSAFYYFENYTPKKRDSYPFPASLKVGDEFYLGELVDEPLKWKVVEIHEDGPIAISEKVLAILPYNDDYADYESSYIRKWLNNQFFHKAFTDEEKSYILEEEYYAISVSRATYGDKKLLKDYLFLPYSSNIANWYGEGKGEWHILHTDFSLKTGKSDDCWLLDVYNQNCPKHVINNEMSARFRHHAGCKMGVRPIMILKIK
jgi:TPR repeat protein